MEFYLVTGFLGAGKTTFLRGFLRILAPKRTLLIINEFGREGVDGPLLRDTCAAMTEISNGSIFCSCRLDAFEAALESAVHAGPDVIVTEASGLADPTGVRRVLGGYPQITYRGSICLADAARLARVLPAALAARRQLAVASLVLLNKTDLASPAQLAEARALIRAANPAAHIRETQFARIEPAWLTLLTPAPGAAQADFAPDITLQKALLQVDARMSRDSLLHCLAQLAESTYRIKGFVQLAEGSFYADCTGPDVRLSPWDGAADGRLVLLAGAGMNLRRAVRQAQQWYPGLVRPLPDSAET